MGGILYTIAAILILFWIVSFLFEFIVSPLIHLLLVIGVIVILIQYFTGSRGKV